MEKKVVRFPISYDERKRNEYGEGYVPCEVSGRWLQFDTTSVKDLIVVDVMTNTGVGAKDHKITELILKKKDILRALANINEKH